ncbi:MAG: hypothetical protein K2N22_05450 [Clostridia bacterium]|nr:hypothetical protein [Clostridia bacterium]
MLVGGGIGAFKGFTRVRSWGVEFILTGLLAIPIDRLITSKLKGSAAIPAGFVSIVVAIIFIGLFMFLFWLFRKLLDRAIEKRKQKSYYSKYFENEQNTVKILGALAANDMKEYKKLTKHKPRQSGGVFSILNRVFGGVVLAIKGIVIAGILSAALLVVIDFTELAQEGGSMYALLGKTYANGSWLFFKKYLFDFLIIGILMACIKAGYSSGVSSSVWSVVVIGLVIGAGALAIHFAFGVKSFVTAAEALNEHLSGKLSSITGLLEQMKINPVVISKAIIALGLFVLMLVPVILIAKFVPEFIDIARGGKIFKTVDGVLGAIALTLTVLVVLLIVGVVVNSLQELEFMEVFNAYFVKSGLATYFYDYNLLAQFGLKLNLAQYLQ